MFIKKQYRKSRLDGQYEKRKFENMDTLINCFQSHECLWNVTSGDYKDQNKKYLALEEVNMAMQEFDMNRYDYQKKWTNL